MVKDIFKDKQGQWRDLGKLGAPKEGQVTVEFPFKKASLSRLGTVLCIVTVVLVLALLEAAAQEGSMSKIKGVPPADSGTAKIPDSLSKSMTGDSAAKVPVAKDARLGTIDLSNIVVTEKKIRAIGWGEYVVGGHCLCCDNMRSADCITVNTTNRTDKVRIKQVLDGTINADTADNATYFGNIYEREMPTKPVALLMAEITLPKFQDIYKVTVYTVKDSLKKKNVVFNCELGYTDQFDRLQWAKKVESSGHEDHITFDLEKPVFTKDILLKVNDGRNRITEVALFAKKN